MATLRDMPEAMHLILQCAAIRHAAALAALNTAGGGGTVSLNGSTAYAIRVVADAEYGNVPADYPMVNTITSLQVDGQHPVVANPTVMTVVYKRGPATDRKWEITNLKGNRAETAWWYIWNGHKYAFAGKEVIPANSSKIITTNVKPGGSLKVVYFDGYGHLRTMYANV